MLAADILRVGGSAVHCREPRVLNNRHGWCHTGSKPVHGLGCAAVDKVRPCGSLNDFRTAATDLTFQSRMYFATPTAQRQVRKRSLHFLPKHQPNQSYSHMLCSLLPVSAYRTGFLDFSELESGGISLLKSLVPIIVLIVFICCATHPKRDVVKTSRSESKQIPSQVVQR